MKNFAEAIVVYGVMVLVRVLPRPAALAVGRSLGRFVGFLGIRKSVATRNLKTALPELSDKEHVRTLSRLYANVGEFVVEFMRPGHIPKKRLVIEGADNIHKAKTHGKGTIILSGHLGNWEAMGRLFPTFPIESNVVAQPMRNPIVERLIREQREKAGLHVIYQKNAIRQILEVFQRNAFVGILMDQDAGKQGIFPTFFGKPASTVPTVASLALKYRCTVLPCFLLKTGKDRYRFEIGKPMALVDTGDRQADIMANTQAYNYMLEDKIKQYPGQYFGWLHRRWKTQSEV